MMIEKRFFQRFACRRRLKVLDTASGRRHEAVCCDISGGGVKIEVPSPLRLRHVLELADAEGGKGKEVKLRGRPVWQQQKGANVWVAGIAFLSDINLMEVEAFLG